MSIKKEKVFILYDLYVNGNILTKELLNNNGITDEDIEMFIENNYLERKGNGYKFIQIDALCNHGIMLHILKKYDKSLKYYKKCYEINPDDFNTNLQLFYRCAWEHNFDNCLIYLKKIFLVNQRNFTEADYNVVLFLLAHIIELPENLKKMAMNISIYDVDTDSEEITEIYKSIILNKFIYSYSKLEDLTSNLKEIKYYLIRELLFTAQKRKNQLNNEIEICISNNDFDGIITYLEKEANMYELSREQNLILHMSKTMKEINETGKLPEKKEWDTDYINNDILNNRYESAMNNLIISESRSNNTSRFMVVFKLVTMIYEKICVIKGIDFQSEYLSNVIVYLKRNELKKARIYFDLFLDSYNLKDYSDLIWNAKSTNHKSLLEELNSIRNGNYHVTDNKLVLELKYSK